MKTVTLPSRWLDAGYPMFVLRELRLDNLRHLIPLYNQHLIQDRHLYDLTSGRGEFAADAFWGMLHTIDTEGRFLNGTPAPSLEQSWRTWLTSPADDGVVYRGKLLYPPGSGLPAAFVTWWEPDGPWAGSSSRYIDRVRGVIETLQFRNPDDSVQLLKHVSTTVLCDTICGPRWSKHLCLDAVREWLASGFDRALLYRHTRLLARRADSHEDAGHTHLGNNARSERALRTQGYRDVGTRLGDTLAVRCGGAVWVQPEEGWMVTDLQESRRLLEARVRPG